MSRIGTARSSVLEGTGTATVCFPCPQIPVESLPHLWRHAAHIVSDTLRRSTFTFQQYPQDVRDVSLRTAPPRAASAAPSPQPVRLDLGGRRLRVLRQQRRRGLRGSHSALPLGGLLVDEGHHLQPAECITYGRHMQGQRRQGCPFLCACTTAAQGARAVDRSRSCLPCRARHTKKRWRQRSAA